MKQFVEGTWAITRSLPVSPNCEEIEVVAPIEDNRGTSQLARRCEIEATCHPEPNHYLSCIEIAKHYTPKQVSEI